MDWKYEKKPIPFTNGTIITEKNLVFLVREDNGEYKPNVDYKYVVIYGLSVTIPLSLEKAVTEFNNSLKHQKQCNR